MLQIYNSLTNRKEPFTPIEAGKVRMYVCGMTVYDFCHLGHARAMVVFDVVVRYLRAQGLQVTYVRNITDIDDKIIRRAQENGEPFTAVTERFIDAMHEDERALSVLPPDLEPKATASLEAIVEMIRTLEAKGFTYQSGGDVYYAVGRFADYGKLSGRKLDEQIAGARVDVSEAKQDAADFVLWKAAKPGEPSWPSPWGEGRPGWHIECSAMSTRHLGNHFDIHGGGLDLKFPHHENEIAQSEAATGEHFANYWMHNGHLLIDNEKMSKSLGNFFTVRDILARYPAEAVRYFLLSSQYRSPLNYSTEALDNARGTLQRLYLALRGLDADGEGELPEGAQARFDAAMDDDFNTPLALSVLHEVATEVNRSRTEAPARAPRLAAGLKGLAQGLGLLQADPEAYLHGGETAAGGLGAAEVEALLERRTAARKARNFAEADRIRNELQTAGIEIEDSPQGTSWRRV